MLGLIGSDRTPPATTDEALISVLDEFIRRHGAITTDPSLLEARRLRLVIANWRGVPPTRAVRIAMIVRISELVDSERRTP